MHSVGVRDRAEGPVQPLPEAKPPVVNAKEKQARRADTQVVSALRAPVLHNLLNRHTMYAIERQ